ncbi:MAG TPA: aminotransferase class I/II-fold pyridoxal phosphate-dependent enzyme [Vicinamibacterales bacterium]|nr:aminotransferase class I/II-fold pyridoxal phosphate-dependent enzyme [Vicinamibacterales bacterium]
MLKAISRYGARVISNTQQLAGELDRRGQLIEGPHIAEFEQAFVNRIGTAHAVTASYGRMAFRYLLQAYDLPPGSEVIFPALTFWVVPEIARVSGLTPVFADVDPNTFTLCPKSFAAAITERTRMVVPTHLWGLPCDMDPILEIAARHNLLVVEDCAHALGAEYCGKQVGTLGDAGFFSFQTLKPLNSYGGGMAVTGNRSVAQRVRAFAESEPWPTVKEMRWNLFRGRVLRISTRPDTFTWTLFPVAYVASHLEIDASAWLWERVRPLDPLPDQYRRRYTNVQAAIALEGLKYLDDWTERTRAHADRMNRALRELPGVHVPVVPPDRTHVYYQYCAYVPDRDATARECIRRGVDVETLHVDVCTRLDMFGTPRPYPGADRGAQAVQLPVYESLTDDQIRRVAQVVVESLTPMAPTSAPQIPQSQS